MPRINFFHELRRLKGARGWAPKALGIAALHYATMMALPLTLLVLGTGFAALPVVAGLTLEVLRSLVRRGLRRQVRVVFLREVARQALDKRALVPEAEVESAFWAAHLTERAITVDAPALLAAVGAGASILGLAAPAIGIPAVASVLAVLFMLVALSIWGDRRSAPVIEAVLEHRHHAAGWVAAAERDGGEIYGQRARAPFLDRLTASAGIWSSAEERLDRIRLQQRAFLGAVLLVGIYVMLRLQQIDPFDWMPSRALNVRSVSGLLLLSSEIPVIYVLTLHIDSLLSARASVTKLFPPSAHPRPEQRALGCRPERLIARALSFSYSGSFARPALAAIDFELDLRRVTLVIAPNGAGKTTLARLICGVLMPNSGTLQIDGVPCSEISHDDFGFVPQNPLIVETLSVEDNIRLVAPDASARAIDDLLRELGLPQPKDRLAAELSRGQQRRVAIARAILKEPRLLLLDEPDVWLDAEGRASLARIIDRQLAARAVVVISHRRDWLPNDSTVLELETQAPSEVPAGAPFGTSNACA